MTQSKRKRIQENTRKRYDVEIEIILGKVK